VGERINLTRFRRRRPLPLPPPLSPPDTKPKEVEEDLAA